MNPLRMLSAAAIAALAATAATAAISGARPAMAEPGEVRLSPALLELLRTEMREVAAGVQVIAATLATGNWDAVQEAAAGIRASYIMEKSLSADQAEELERSLPETFKLLDAEFHARAEKLAEAAAAHDAELTGFHYARLLETCTRCHTSFAATRFPGFAAPAGGGHRH